MLGSLDREERAAFEAHLAGCDDCAMEVRELRRVADALAHAVPQRTPRPELRRRVLESRSRFVTPGRVKSASERDDAMAPARSHNRGGGRSRWLCIQPSGAYAISKRASIRRCCRHRRLGAVAEARRVSGELQSGNGHDCCPRPGADRSDGTGGGALRRARVHYGAALAAWCSPLESSRAFPADGCIGYGLSPRKRPSALDSGHLGPDGWETFFSTPPDILAPAAVAVTIEPAGGVPAPTGDMYLVGKPATIS